MGDVITGLDNVYAYNNIAITVLSIWSIVLVGGIAWLAKQHIDVLRETISVHKDNLVAMTNINDTQKQHYASITRIEQEIKDQKAHIISRIDTLERIASGIPEIKQILYNETWKK